MKRRPAPALVLLVIWLASCTSTTTVAPSSPAASAPPSVGAESPSAAPSDEPESLSVDHLAEVLVDDLTVRAAPGLNADRHGVLPAGEPVYLVDGPSVADGYEWYQLAAVREPFTGDCGEPAPPPSLACWPGWFGWAASASPSGEPWLAPRSVPCPPANLDTTTYIGLLAMERLVCFSDQPWTLEAYMAPEQGGRGCFLPYGHEPRWLDPCAIVFPQPEESQIDESSALVMHVHPELGVCGFGGINPECPFAALTGQWVDIMGHLDDPAAQSCLSVRNPGFEDNPLPPPDPAEVVLTCRAYFVATEVTPRTD